MRIAAVRGAEKDAAADRLRVSGSQFRLDCRNCPSASVTRSGFTMTKTSASQKTPKLDELIPRRIRKLLGDAPTLPFEDPERFNALHTEFVVAFDPKDMVEQYWVKDLAELRWNIMGLRNMRRAAVENALPAAAAELMGTEIKKAFEHPDDYTPGDRFGAEGIATNILRGAARGNLEDRIFFNGILRDANVTHDMIRVVAYAKSQKAVSALDGAISLEQYRFDQIVRNLEKRRTTKTAMERSFGITRADVVDLEVPGCDAEGEETT